MIAHLEVEARDLAVGLADLKVLFEPFGGAFRDVGDRTQRLLARLLSFACALLEVLDLLTQLFRFGNESLLFLTLGLSDLLAEGFLFGTQRLKRLRGLTPGLVGFEHGVNSFGVAATRFLGLAHAFGVLTEQSQIDHVFQGTVPRRPRMLERWKNYTLGSSSTRQSSRMSPNFAAGS